MRNTAAKQRRTISKIEDVKSSCSNDNVEEFEVKKLPAQASSQFSGIILSVVALIIAILAATLSLSDAGLLSLPPWIDLSLPSDIKQSDDKPAAFSATVNLEFFNRLDIPVDTYWKDYNGEEQFWFHLEPFSYTGNISSIRGHVWSFRTADEAQDLLFEEFIDLTHCGKIHIAAPEHIEALRAHCLKTGTAVLGNFPRAQLVRNVLSAVPRTFTTHNPPFRSYEHRDAESPDMEIEVISHSPKLLRVDNFLSDEECDHLMEIAVDRLHEDEQGSSAWLEHGETDIVSSITRRIFELIGMDPEITETFYFAEKMHISRYEAGQEYLPHYDALDMTTSQRNMPHNRFATVLMFLNDVEESQGGVEVWPRGNGANEFALAACDSSQELKVQPKRGSLVIQYNMFEDGNMDEAALRASCPIIGDSAEKWTSAMYFWDPFVQWAPEAVEEFSG